MNAQYAETPTTQLILDGSVNPVGTKTPAVKERLVCLSAVIRETVTVTKPSI